MAEGRECIEFHEGEVCRQMRPIRAAWDVNDCCMNSADWAILLGTVAHLSKQREIN